MVRSIIYAILLGIGMAACLSQNENEAETEAEQTTVVGLETEEEKNVPAPSSLIIQKGKVGDIAIGTLIDSLRKQAPAGYTLSDTVLLQEGTQAAAYLLKPNGYNKGIIVEQVCNPACRVWRINVQHPDFRTPKGIGVGSKYSEARQHYAISDITLGDGGLVALSKAGGITLVLDSSQIPVNQRAKLTPETVPANTLIKNILIY